MRRSLYKKKFYSGSYLHTLDTKQSPGRKKAFFSVTDNFGKASTSSSSSPPVTRPCRSADYEPEFSSGLTLRCDSHSQDSDTFLDKSQESDIFVHQHSDGSDIYDERKEFNMERRRCQSERRGSSNELEEENTLSWRSPSKNANWVETSLTIYSGGEESFELDEASVLPQSPPTPLCAVLKTDISIESDDTSEFYSKQSSETSDFVSAQDSLKVKYQNLSDVSETSDIFDLCETRVFQKQRSFDSDETSGFVSKHSSETADFSSKMSSSSGNFSKKHMSEPSTFDSYDRLELAQRMSEPTELLPRNADSNRDDAMEPMPSMSRLMSIEDDYKPEFHTGAISKQKRDRFTKSKRSKHFNLRRIDDADKESTERFLLDHFRFSRQKTGREESVEMSELGAGRRLKEEVGLPPNFMFRSTETSDRNLHKWKSDKTIMSCESERSTMYDFEAFCDAVMFTGELAPVKECFPSPRKRLTHSSDALSDNRPEEEQMQKTEEKKSRKPRKTKSERNLAQRLKCLLL